MRRRTPKAAVALTLICLATAGIAFAQPAHTRPAPAAEKPATTQPAGASGEGKPSALPDLLGDREGTLRTLQWVAMITVISIAPALAVLVTCFTRIIVVLTLLRQALSSHQVPPNQVLFGLAMLMTLTVMAPVLTAVHHDALAPYLDGSATREQALTAAGGHLRGFMIKQIESAGNSDEVYLFLDKATASRKDLTWEHVPTVALIPAFVVSELKVAFFLGFQMVLPFLVIDLLVGSVLISMGMLMLPPVLVSLPFKLLLFVLADGWHRVVGTLMSSFG